MRGHCELTVGPGSGPARGFQADQERCRRRVIDSHPCRRLVRLGGSARNEQEPDCECRPGDRPCGQRPAEACVLPGFRPSPHLYTSGHLCVADAADAGERASDTTSTTNRPRPVSRAPAAGASASPWISAPPSGPSCSRRRWRSPRPTASRSKRLPRRTAFPCTTFAGSCSTPWTRDPESSSSAETHRRPSRHRRTAGRATGLQHPHLPPTGRRGLAGPSVAASVECLL